MALSLRNPETQTKVSSVLTLASIVVLAVAVLLAFSNFNWETREFMYRTAGLRAPVVFAGGSLSLVLAGTAFYFAYASAAERRNPRSGLSWMCFAASALLIVAACIFLAAYRMMAWVIRA